MAESVSMGERKQRTKKSMIWFEELCVFIEHLIPANKGELRVLTNKAARAHIDQQTLNVSYFFLIRLSRMVLCRQHPAVRLKDKNRLLRRNRVLFIIASYQEL